jgi:hypothetical protein
MSMSHKLASALLASAMAVFATTPSRADIGYDVNVQFPLLFSNVASPLPPGSTVSISGSIITDGNLGPLTTSDIISYFVNFRPSIGASDSFFGPSPPLTPPIQPPVFPNPQAAHVSGTALTATDDGLFFDFGGNGGLGFSLLDPFLRFESTFGLSSVLSQPFPGVPEVNINYGIDIGASVGGAIGVGTSKLLLLCLRLSPVLSRVLDCRGCSWRAEVFSAGGDGVRKPPDPALGAYNRPSGPLALFKAPGRNCCLDGEYSTEDAVIYCPCEA